MFIIGVLVGISIGIFSICCVKVGSNADICNNCLLNHEKTIYAHWIPADKISSDDGLPIYWACSNCGEKSREYFKRCNYCDAKMEEA